MGVFRMAWRNVWRSRRRSLATIAAMSLAMLATVIYGSLVEGYLNNMERNVLDFELGAVQVFARGYQDRPSIHSRIDDSEGLLARLSARGFPATDRLLGAGLAAFGETSAGVRLIGLNVERDAGVLAIGKQVYRGDWLDSSDPAGVVLGRRLAHTLGVDPGGELIILSQAADGSLANDLYHVRGVLKSVGEISDRAGVFMTAAAFRSLMVVPTGAHQIIVGQPGSASLNETVAAVEQAAPGLDVFSWRRLQPTMATMFDSAEGMIGVMMLIVYIVVAIVVLNTMLIAVFERIREFGVLKALGFGPGRILKIIFLESYLQAGLAVICGLLLSAPFLWYLSRHGLDMSSLSGAAVMGMAMMSTWYAVVNPETVILPIVLLLIMVGVAVVYPAFKAANVRPVEAMRYR